MTNKKQIYGLKGFNTKSGLNKVAKKLEVFDINKSCYMDGYNKAINDIKKQVDTWDLIPECQRHDIKLKLDVLTNQNSITSDKEKKS